MSIQIISDHDTERGLMAVLSDNRLIGLYRPESPQLGAVMAVRIMTVFPSHHLADATGPDGLKLTVRLKARDRLKAGDIVTVTLTSQPRGDKPAQSVTGVEYAGRYLIVKPHGDEVRPPRLRWSHKSTPQPEQAPAYKGLQDSLASLADAASADIIIRRSAEMLLASQTAAIPEHLLRAEFETLLMHSQARPLQPAPFSQLSAPALLYPGMTPSSRLALYYPDARLRQADRTEWDDIIETASGLCSDSVTTPRGAVFWIEPTRAGIMIDCDSARSGLAGYELCCELIPHIIRVISLRCLSGRIIIDFPRQPKAQQNHILSQIKRCLSDDVRSVEIPGFTRSGLCEMVIRHTHTPLDDWHHLL